MSHKIDMKGNSFGDLFVIEEAPSSKSGQRRWLCQCSCGKQKIIQGSSLRNGKTISCGCYQKKRISETLVKNMIGKTFGKLKVIKKNENSPPSSQRHISWICQCECGEIVSVTGSQLRSGKTKSCGCYGKTIGTNNLKDLTGQIFGKLTVIKQNGRTKNRVARWLCRCECGKEKTISSNSLINGNTRSCGCLRKYEWEGHTFRSRWEVWLSMYYDINEIKWEYEPFTINLTINNRNTRYTPDFILDNGCIIEVKGRQEGGRFCRLDKPLKMIEMGYDLMIIKRCDLEKIIGFSIYAMNKTYTSGGFDLCKKLLSSR